mgnify:CR=1 FL=1
MKKQNNTFKRYNSIGNKELLAATKVIKKGNLSSFIGAWGNNFYGGEYVRKFEKNCESFFNVKYAVAVNSWTSGLIASVGAIGIEPGDEVILPTWTMSACAMSILHWNAIPVFADIDKETFTIDPKSIVKNISKKTRAILAVDIFGHPHNFSKIKVIAKKYNLKIIVDSAQAPYSFYKDKLCATLGDVGGISLNYHKHIHTGEGGVIFTNNKKIYNKLLLIRNHGEAVVEKMGHKDLTNIIGYNFRLGEIESAIGIEQLKKLKQKTIKINKVAEILTKNLKGLSGLKTPIQNKNCTHSYYVYPLIIDPRIVKVPREKIINTLKDHGLQGFVSGYTNLHLLPIFQKKIAYGTKGFPWNVPFNKNKTSYAKGICPVAERLHSKTLIAFHICLYDLESRDLNFIIKKFKKVWPTFL